MKEAIIKGLGIIKTEIYEKIMEALEKELPDVEVIEKDIQLHATVQITFNFPLERETNDIQS